MISLKTLLKKGSKKEFPSSKVSERVLKWREYIDVLYGLVEDFKLLMKKHGIKEGENGYIIPQALIDYFKQVSIKETGYDPNSDLIGGYFPNYALAS